MKINKLLITIIAAAFIFMGCSNSLDSTPSATGRYSVTGKISFAGSSGAAPVIFTPSTNGRNATTSFNNEHLSLNLYAYKYGQNGPDNSKKYDNVVVDQSGAFIFCFEEKGSYIIYAEVLKDGTKCASGTTNIEITGFTTSSINIFTSPVITEDGKIQLAVSAATDTDPQIKKVCVSWIRSFGGRAEDDVGGNNESSDLEAAMERRNAVESGEYNMSFDLVNGTTEITYTNFPGGSWLAKISFEDENENSLYSCQEIINVYPGFITNLWYGTTPAITAGNFKVTKNMVTKYGTEVVPNFNQIMLWNNFEWNDEEYNGRFYYLVNENSISSFNALPVPDFVDETDPSELNELGADVHSYFSTGSDFPFECAFRDYEGNIYLALYSYDAPYPGSGISSSRSGWNNIGWSDLQISNELRQGFTVDLKTNIAYGLEWNDDAYIYKYPDMISSKGITPTSIRLHLDLREPNNFCVYNNIAYILKKGEDGEYSISSFDMNSEDDPIPAIKTISFDLNDVIGFNLYDYAYIEDILYQDGYIYLLYKESASYLSDSNMKIFSRGAVLRVNLTDGSVTASGFTSNSLARDEIQLQGFDGDNAMYTDPELTIPKIPPLTQTQKNNNYPEYIYFPSENDNCFYGPTKFVAVKPKKLVISDEGLAFYTDNDALRYRNVNRIVYVDLDNFANGISEEIILDSSIKLSTDKTDVLKNNEIDGDNVEFYMQGGDGLQQTISYYVGIPCGDN